jgi:phosphoribosylamine---glycine ligase
MTHGDYPREDDPPATWSGYPINISEESSQHIHWQQVMSGFAPRLVGGRVERTRVIVTAGQYPIVVTGSGPSVEWAAIEAYDVAWRVKWPSGIMFRTDVGKRLEKELPLLQEHGFALGMEYA